MRIITLSLPIIAFVAILSASATQKLNQMYASSANAGALPETTLILQKSHCKPFRTAAQKTKRPVPTNAIP
jgi:hypothetical protein